ncbi:MAG TPA: cytochrome c [Candidatus Eisenbacteria bacterium]|jgi:mono/diheme cytochrome c family protein|nr:cytochrome c [Candidatus Eisenbacteria bacterium]
MSRARMFAAIASGFALLAAATGCQKRNPAIEYMPNMAYGPRVAAQHEDPLRPGFSVMRPPVPGTVPRGYTPYRFAQADTTQAMEENVNPLPHTADVLARGQKVYDNTCIVCHGARGDGQGSIVPVFPQPPTLFSDKVRNWPDGRIFHVISRGQNLMPSYASQILPEDRWAVIAYVRALQRAAHPLPSDLPGKAKPDSATASASADTAKGGAR